MEKKWTLSSAKADYANRNKSCNNCEFANTRCYTSCMVSKPTRCIIFPKFKAKKCKYYTNRYE